MINSVENVPKVLSESRDFQVFLKLLDILTISKKTYIDNWIRFIDPMRCPSKYLPLLASYVGYEYDNTLSYDSNRIIIKYYPYLIRNRGTVKGLMLAVAVAISANDARTVIASAMEMMNIVYVKEDNLMKVYIYYPSYLRKVNDLVEVVRPVGVGCQIIESKAVSGREEITIRDTVTRNIENYAGMKRSIISELNALGHGEVGENE